MAGIKQSHSSQMLKLIVDRIFHTGQLNRRDYLLLVTTFLSDYKVTADERRQINRIFDDLQIGRLKLVDR